MEKRRMSIRWKLLSIGLLPTTLLGLAICFFGMVLIYGLLSDGIHEELENATYVLKGCFDLTVRGDYTYDGNTLMKGNVNISDSTMLYDIKNNSAMDTTIFWGDTRVLTTIENQYGVSAVGSKANADVVDVVLEHGSNYFSKNISIGDMSYIGFYTPLMNGDGSIVGMVFAGKPISTIYRNILEVMTWFLGFAMIAIILSATISRIVSKGMIQDINIIKQYLHTISDGDFSVSMSERIVKRKDELGEIGIYADKMRGNLKTLVELDALTSLYNRRSFDKQINKLIQKETPFTMVMCDIDWFKKVNDKYGHDCGDYILTNVSAMIRQSVEECGFASRWGGEEFLLVYALEFSKVKDKVESLAEQVRECEFEYNGQIIHVTMTFGLKEMENGVPYENIIKIADDNLYMGKANGRNQIVY